MPEGARIIDEAQNDAEGVEEARIDGDYLELLSLIERLHRRLLDVVKDEFERLDLLDVNAVQALRKHAGIETPCIIISADDSDVIRDRAKAVGYRFLPKPVNATRLRALILALTRGS